MSPISVLFLCARSLCWMNPKECSLHCIKLRHVHIELCFLLMWSMSRNISVLAIIGLIVTFHALQSTLICLSCHFTCLRLPFSSALLKQRAVSISAFVLNTWTLCWMEHSWVGEASAPWCVSSALSPWVLSCALKGELPEM